MKALNTKRSFLKLLLVTAVLFLCVSFSYAQPVLPQRTLTVTPTQSIHFGTICATGWPGGNVVVGWDGSRTSTGTIVLLSMAPSAQPAIFEVKLCEGRNISISFDATTTLTGSNGGSLTLELGPTDKGPNGASFATNSDCNFVTTLRMGGTLRVPGSPFPGIYSGSFAITFNQE